MKKDFLIKKPFEEQDFYMSPEGYRIFTESYHLKRGYCCKNNCKHCPYKKKIKNDKKRI